jgi:hypothetical protein
VSRYTIVRNGTPLTTLAGGTTTLVDPTTHAGTAYAYTVTASDAAGNTSEPSTGASVTTPTASGPADTQAPTAPSALIATPTYGQINLAWTASADTGMGFPEYFETPFSWWFDLSLPPSPGSKDLNILVNYPYCTPDDPIVLNIAADGTTVTITAFARWTVDPSFCHRHLPVPVVVHLDQPIGSLTLLDGSAIPGIERYVAGQPAPLRSGAISTSHPYTDCSGTIEDQTFFKLVAPPTVVYGVYCAVMPTGWAVVSRTLSAGPLGPNSNVPLSPYSTLRVEYAGPNGESSILVEGAIAASDYPPKASHASFRIPAFGEKAGSLETVGNKHYFLLTNSPYPTDSADAAWETIGTGMGLDEFKAFTATLIPVAS